ncbi:MAG: DUF6266 family protein [Pedobacter sp.]
MGKLPQGPFGATTGKIGNIVSYVLKGETVFRRVGKTKKKRSAGQAASRQRFKLVNDLLHHITGFINLGFLFKMEGTPLNQHNIATSLNMRNAIKGSYPNFEIDYRKVVVSEGKLLAANSPTAIVTQHNVTINWDYVEERDFSFRNDRAMVLLIYPLKQSSIYYLSAAERSAGTQVFTIAADETNESPEIYISFLAEDRLSVSNSTWISYLANEQSSSVIPLLCNSCFFNVK